MKRMAYALLLMIIFSMIFALASAPAVRPAAAATEPVVGPNTPGNGNDAPVTQADLQDLQAKAEKAAKAANDAQSNANSVVNNANNAVNTVNLLLNFIQAGSLFGTVLAGATGILAARSGSRTLNYYREELDKAHAELEEMRGRLTRETEQIRINADKAIRSLALMQLGEQQLEMRNIKGALQMYQQAYELDPTNRATNYFLGELYIQDKDVDKGITHLRNALSNGSDYAPAEAALGFAFRLQAEKAADAHDHDILYAQAEERLLRALEIDPNVLDINGESVQGVLGGLYKREGRIDKAIYRYEEARKVTPNNSYPIVNLAMLHFLEGNVGQARDAFERSARISDRMLEANPYDFWPRFDSIDAALVLGNLEKAKQSAQVAIDQVKAPNALESFLGDLVRMKNSPHPPQGIDEVIEMVQIAIDRLKAV